MSDTALRYSIDKVLTQTEYSFPLALSRSDFFLSRDLSGFMLQLNFSLTLFLSLVLASVCGLLEDMA